MRKLLLLMLTLSFSVIGFAADENLPEPKGEQLTQINKIVAVVNKDIITEAELQQSLAAARSQFKQRGLAMPDAKSFRAQVLEGLIFQKLQLQIASQNNITISDKQVDEAIENIAQQNHITVPVLKEKVQGDHISFDTFRKQIKDQLIISTLQHEALAGKVEINKAEVEKFKKKFESENATVQYHVVDYLIPLTDEATSAQKEKAKQLATKLSQKLQSSSTVNSKEASASDLGWHTASDLPDLFASMVIKMADGSASQPVLAGNGYHIIKLLGTKQQDTSITDQQARELLIQQQGQKLLKTWLDSLRSNAYIKIYD